MRLFCGCVVISIHALREEGDASGTQRTPPYGQFLSTPSARRATSDGRCPSVPARNFYPRPPRGGRPTATVGETDSYEFLSTPSARRATHLRRCAEDALKISIHALREEGDVVSTSGGVRAKNFYPRPPRGGRRKAKAELVKRYDFYPRPPRGGRRINQWMDIGDNKFLSTPSARRATYSFAICLSSFAYFYPRPPRGGRRFKRDYSLLTTIFLSTPSARRATLPLRRLKGAERISIHALREEGDFLCL